jgi:ATP/maltotriose-dependent transcriptional regulator MalT/DNA-binding SARP family transcriptional activator
VRLSALAERPLVLLEAGPGAGKTLAMLALTRACSTAVAWVSLEPGDGEAGPFMRLLVQGLQAHVPPLAADLAGLLGNPGVEPRVLVQALIVSLAAFNPPHLTLVIDDAHHALEAAPDMLKALVGAVDRYPSGFRVVVATRRRWPYPLGKAIATERAVRLDAARLGFDEEETAAFLTARAPGGEVPEAWWCAASRLDGWPLGLALIARRLDGVAEGWGGPAAGAGALQAYVVEELLDAQPAALRQLLLQVAELQTITAEACRWILQLPDAEQLLAALAAEHMLQPLADGTSYRLPPHLKEALVAEGVRRLPELTRNAWHRRAAAWFQGQGQEEAAVPHLLAVRDWDGAAVSCALSFTAMSTGGRRAEIDRWIAAFPPEVLGEHPVLLLWRGHGRARRGELTEALLDYEAAREAFTRRDEPGLAFKALVRECTLAGVQGDLAAFGRRLFQAQGLAAHGEPADLADFHLARALAAEQRGDLGLVAECNEAVLALSAADDRELASCQCIARLNMYGSALDRGDLEAARSHAGAAADLAARHGFHGQALYARFLLAHLHVATGELDAASRICAQLPPFWPETLDFVERGVAWTVLGHLAQARGEWREAEQRLRRALDTFCAGSFQEGAKVALERLMWLAIQRGQPERALTWHVQAADAGRGSLRDLALQLPLARARHLAGQPAVACDTLQGLLPALAAMGAPVHEAHGWLLLAAASSAAGDTDRAREALARGEAIVRRNGYEFLVGADAALAAELAPLAVSTPAPPEGLAHAPAGPQDVATLVVRCLGTFEVHLGGVSLDPGLRRKAKLILAVLAAHPRGLPLEEIAERLGVVDLTPGNVRTLQADISELRRVFEPTLQKGKDSRYVQLTENRYHLVQAQVGLVDVWAFERAAAAGDRLRDRAPAEAVVHYEEAMALFRGNLLEEGGFLKHFAAERESFKRQALAILSWLARHHEASGAAVAAEDAWRRAISLAPVDEDLYLSLMHVLQRRGEGERGRHVYWECRKAFKLKLGDVPSREFEQASQALLRL